MRSLKLIAATAALLASTGIALADGELNIYNWGNYTAPELIKKFEAEQTFAEHDRGVRDGRV